MELELKHLRHLQVIARAGSLNRAATQLVLPQPALSRELRRVEELLGRPLFERERTGVRPTPFGQLILDYAEGILARTARIGPDLAHQCAQRAGALRVGWAETAFSGFLLNALDGAGLGDQAEIRTAESTAQVLDWLGRGNLELAVLSEQCDVELPADTGRVDLVEDPLMVMLPDWHPLASQPAVHLPELEHERWISSVGPDRCREFLARVCGPFGFAPVIAHHVPVSGPRDDIVRYQGDVTLVQQSRPLAPGVVHRPIPDLLVRTSHFLLYREDSPVAGRVELLAELILEASYEDRGRIPGPRGRVGELPWLAARTS
ncbi:LysR family transcriptional regulator [Amycolatopsis sp. PS_44_ISF1]|uniref:LysR family transcriptional regulator n=1 Tax=Amycolatopsis sp. PS_44_ISF1 TaxID=2974917 RepID=UPI0028E08349|nr:LysR family transcriptional regulator [Amycolatopsis sp. PS_44_ISF1]MDT8914760.1 LysR family transcriptional regulator [Amycolatopsis sp. PS_44_ISF1]